MDPVVWFALGTLTVVFFLSGFVLIALIWRRCQQQNARSRADVNFIFSKNRDDKVENLAEMVPLLDTEMGKLEEKVKEAGEGPLSDVMAILSLTTRVVKVLSEVSVTRASPKIYEVIAQSMFRVDTHFHELLEFTPVEANDLRVIEARALTLTTTVWSLNAAFTLHGFDQVKEVEAMVIKMYEHVDALRQQIPGYIGAAKNGEGEGEGEAHEEEEKTGSQSTEETTAETTPGDAPVDTVQISHFPVPPSIQVTAEVNDPPLDEETPPPPPPPAAASASAAAADDETAPSNVDETGVPSAPSLPSSPSKSDSVPIPVSNGSPDQTDASHSSAPPKTEAETEDVVDPLSQGHS